MRTALILILTAATATAACNTPERQKAQAASHSTTAAPSITLPNNGSVIPGTPEGDLGDWVKDIRRGLADVTAIAATDAPGAQRKTLDLYVTRQEYAEMYYGVDGRAKVSQELADAIEAAELRFHDLMKLLGTPNPVVSDVEAAVAALDQQQAVVAKLWQQSDAKPARASLQ